MVPTQASLSWLDPELASSVRRSLSEAPPPPPLHLLGPETGASAENHTAKNLSLQIRQRGQTACLPENLLFLREPSTFKPRHLVIEYHRVSVKKVSLVSSYFPFAQSWHGWPLECTGAPSMGPMSAAARLGGGEESLELCYSSLPDCVVAALVFFLLRAAVGNPRVGLSCASLNRLASMGSLNHSLAEARKLHNCC